MVSSRTITHERPLGPTEVALQNGAEIFSAELSDKSAEIDRGLRTLSYQ